MASPLIIEGFQKVVLRYEIPAERSVVTSKYIDTGSLFNQQVWKQITTKLTFRRLLLFSPPHLYITSRQCHSARFTSYTVHHWRYATTITAYNTWLKKKHSQHLALLNIHQPALNA